MVHYIKTNNVFCFCLFFQFLRIMAEEKMEFDIDELKSIMALMNNKGIKNAIQSLLKVSGANNTEEKIQPGM